MKKNSIVPGRLYKLCQRLDVLLEKLTQAKHPEERAPVQKKLRRQCFNYLAQYQIGHPILRRRAEEVTDVEEVQPLIEALVTVMRACGGIGLAAPQIGIGLRLAVVECSKMSRRGQQKEPDKQFPLTVLINPVITAEIGEMVVSYEGCLSHLAWGDDTVLAFTRRPESIAARYLNEHGEQRDHSFYGLHGRAVQHEVEHLDGIFFHDRAVFKPNSFTVRRHLEETRQWLRQHGIETH